MAKLLSSFELLVKPIASAMPLLPGGDRTIVQAYLLLLSNLNPISEPEVALRLKFTVGGMPLNSRKLLTIFDPGTGNQFDTLDVNGKTGDLVLPSGPHPTNPTLKFVAMSKLRFRLNRQHPT